MAVKGVGPPASTLGRNNPLSHNRAWKRALYINSEAQFILYDVTHDV